MVARGSSGQGHRDVVKHKRAVVLRVVYGRQGAHLVREEGADDENSRGGNKGRDYPVPQL